MSRTTRTLLLLTLFAVGGVVALSVVAQRYARLLEGPAAARLARDGRSSSPAPGPTPDGVSAVTLAALRDLDVFIEVRAVLRRRGEGRQLDAAGLQRMRDDACAQLGLAPERYAEIRGAYRRWRQGTRPTEPWDAAFALRGRQLARADLGNYESLDA